MSRITIVTTMITVAIVLRTKDKDEKKNERETVALDTTASFFLEYRFHLLHLWGAVFGTVSTSAHLTSMSFHHRQQ